MAAHLAVNHDCHDLGKDALCWLKVQLGSEPLVPPHVRETGDPARVIAAAHAHLWALRRQFTAPRHRPARRRRAPCPRYIHLPATGRPFDTVAMRALLRRLMRRPNLDTLRVWNNNEGPTLEQLVTAVPPQGGMESLLRDMSA